MAWLRIACLVCLGCSLGLPEAFAKEDVGTTLVKAESSAKAGRYAEAGKLFAQAMNTASKKPKDLLLQQRVHSALADVARDGQRRNRTPDAMAKFAEGVGAILSGMSEDLDSKRNNAFMSRGLVSATVILSAAHAEDRTHLAAACEAAIAHGRVSKCGAYAKTMAVYAQGLLHAEKRESDKACPLLQKALDRTAKEQWSRTGVIVATETAAAYLAAGDPKAATAALHIGEKLALASEDRAVAQLWRAAVKVRLAGAPAEVLAPYVAATKVMLDSAGVAGGAGGAGGKGGRGGRAGEPDRSKVGAAWKKLSKKKPFVTVKRTAKGYEIRHAFDKKFSALQPFDKGVTHHSDGGVMLSFWNGGVRLYQVDIEGRAGGPGGSSEPREFNLYFPLAMGETWGVNKVGEVVLSGK